MAELLRNFANAILDILRPKSNFTNITTWTRSVRLAGVAIILLFECISKVITSRTLAKMGFMSFVFGPKLYQEYGAPKGDYEPGSFEKFSEQILSTLSLMWNIGYYTSPLIATFLYRRGYLVTESIPSFAKFTTSVGIIVVISLCIRGFGRTNSRSYSKMVKALEQAKEPQTAAEGKRTLRQFDFDFRAWPVDFDVNSVQGESKKKALMLAKKRDARPFRLATLPCQVAAFLAIRTFGIRMIYPGYIKMLQYYMETFLITGRAKLIEDHKAMRYKVRTIDANEIDSIFVDYREHSVNGKTLVICSEGNAAFYEIGIMGTPLSLKYSVLGWNHPGFGGSTGAPYPDQDKNAIDAMVQFAIHQLGFQVEDILLFGWSIGGVSTLWAATLYPNVKGVILDGTFDDVLYLAQQHMPQGLAGVVRIAIRDYCNLNNVESIHNYHGPVSIIRRTDDEVISENNRIETNRGNYLVLAMLKYRYPHIFKTPQLTRIKNILSKPIEKRNYTTSTDELCMSRLITYASDQGKSFPMLIGDDYLDETRDQMAEFLLHKHFRDYNSTHCTPLPADFFNIPWDIPIEHGFVFT